MFTTKEFLEKAVLERVGVKIPIISVRSMWTLPDDPEAAVELLHELLDGSYEFQKSVLPPADSQEGRK